MALRFESPQDWLERKRREVAAEEPLSIQANIAALSQRLWAAEQKLDAVRKLHVEDYCTRVAYCKHCHRPWPCPSAQAVA